MLQRIGAARSGRADTKVGLEVLFWDHGVCAGDGPTCRARSVNEPNSWAGLEQTELAGTGDRLGPAVDLELAEDDPIVSFDGTQGDEEPITDLMIGPPLRDQLQDFQLSSGQRL